MSTKIYLVSFPRSGQHYMQRMIERVTGKDDYCELYHCADACPAKRASVQQRIPCALGRSVQKNHDFELDLSVNPEGRYAVLIRNPLDALISYYWRESKRSGLALNWTDAGVPQRVEHSEAAWKNFIQNRAKYWKLFVTKWCNLAKEYDNVALFYYEKLIIDRDEFIAFFDFCFGPDTKESADEHILKQISIMRDPSRRVDKYRLGCCSRFRIY